VYARNTRRNDGVFHYLMQNCIWMWITELLCMHTLLGHKLEGDIGEHVVKFRERTLQYAWRFTDIMKDKITIWYRIDFEW
jgi:hypothetical protein